VLERLPELGISIDNVTRQLEDEGVEKSNKPFDKLMKPPVQTSHSGYDLASSEAGVRFH
jgi:hypothetical protein